MPGTPSARSLGYSGLADHPGDEIVQIVDDENRPVGAAPRRRMRAEVLPHRATYIFVMDGGGRILVQRRTDTKDLFPGYYDLAAGGVVAAGESYEECAVREAEEELGIRDTPLVERFDFHLRRRPDAVLRAGVHVPPRRAVRAAGGGGGERAVSLGGGDRARGRCAGHAGLVACVPAFDARG